MRPGPLQAALLIEQHLVVLGEVRDAEELRQAVAVEVLKPHQAVAADVRGRDLPGQELVHLARARVQHPHLAVRFHAELVHPVAVHICRQQRREAGVMIKVVAPAQARWLARLFKRQHREVAELRVGRIAVFANHDLLADAVRQKAIHLHRPPIRHRLHIVAEERLARIGGQEHRGAERRGRPAGHQREFHSSVAVQVFRDHQALEVQARRMRFPKQRPIEPIAAQPPVPDDNGPIHRPIRLGRQSQ